jgi:CBS domain containing-hemolysin-like protein
MDPDGLLLLLSIALLAACFALCRRLGAVLSGDHAREHRTVLGFSDQTAGLCTAFYWVCAGLGFAVLHLAQDANMLWVGLVELVLIGMVCVLLFALGGARGSRGGHSGVFAALGKAVSAPAKVLFRARGLSAVSAVTEEELLSMADDAEEQDIIDESQKEMIANIVELDDVQAGDIMTHRTELVSVSENTPVHEVVRLALAEGVSRLPVYRKTLDDIVGILHVKDLFALWGQPEHSDAPARNYMRKAMFVPEACRARELLVEFKLKHTQIAVVVDEYGGTSGLVTMEDILEEIVGNIQDEFDNEEEPLTADGDQGCIAAGSAELEDVFDAFSLEMPTPTDDEADDFDTVGGLIADRLGHIPTAQEQASVVYGGIVFTVIEADERRIVKVRCERACPEKADETPAAAN